LLPRHNPAHHDPIQQLAIFRIGTGHCGLKAYMRRIGVSETICVSVDLLIKRQITVLFNNYSTARADVATV